MNENRVPVEFVLPTGIGDVSWVYSKICHLPKLADFDITVYMPDEEPRRGEHFVRLLPEVKWGGYLDVASGSVMTQCVPSDWPPWWWADYAPLHRFGRVNVSANCHLEMGLRLEDWLPKIPTDFHYPMNLRTSGLPENKWLGLYVSSRVVLKDQLFWHIWTEDQWVEFADRVSYFIREPKWLMIGAGYDADRTQAVGERLKERGHVVQYMLGQPLDMVIDAISKLRYLFAYPSGIAILADVVNTPAISLLPTHLTGLKSSYADPKNLESGKYKCFVQPTVDEVVLWFDAMGRWHVR